MRQHRTPELGRWTVGLDTLSGSSGRRIRGQCTEDHVRETPLKSAKSLSRTIAIGLPASQESLCALVEPRLGQSDRVNCAVQLPIPTADASVTDCPARPVWRRRGSGVSSEGVARAKAPNAVNLA